MFNIDWFIEPLIFIFQLLKCVFSNIWKIWIIFLLTLNSPIVGLISCLTKLLWNGWEWNLIIRRRSINFYFGSIDSFSHLLLILMCLTQKLKPLAGLLGIIVFGDRYIWLNPAWSLSTNLRGLNLTLFFILLNTIAYY